uniref:Uncharacterized protein n=1 Tax=Craspedostauros australis TaxID=1486917 RepID=A0A7R9ZQL6_9STRA|mmetsp:Transcript_5993/g.16277  ORF Transcript_5993/g.16277 Transcript_5993/m.16277 type:complete len:294 (+) Transcript_5993:3-884(+)
MILAIFFFKFEWAEAICEKFWVLTSHEKSHIAITQRSLQTGLIAAGRYRETKRRRYLKRLRQMIVTLKNVKKLKGAKVTHQSRILEAEELSLRKSKDIRGVQNAYDEAIKAAAEAGHLHEAALTAELAGEFFLRSKRNTYVQDYFVQALGFYEGWGAHSKANDLRQRHALYTASSKSDKLNMRASSHSMLIPNTVQDMSTSRRTTVDLISVFTPPQSMVGSSVSEKGSRMQGDTDQQQQQHKPRHLAQRHHQTQTQQPQQNMRHNHHQQHEMQQKHDEVDADDDDVSVLTGGS